MTVYANGLRNLRQEAGQQDHRGKLPDTCMTPPENPATPPGVPVPYPSFGTDGDLTNGTSTVKIGGETVSKKNLSYYSKTTGTEAGLRCEERCRDLDEHRQGLCRCLVEQRQGRG